MMKIFDYLEEHDYEQLVFCQDKKTGLKSIIAIHDTTLGPALGGMRIFDYKSEEDAIEDALRLAKGMTYKNSAAGLNLGGGKAVVLGDPDKIKSEEFFRTFGRFVEGLAGRYITAEDMNTTPQDMAYIKDETDHVVGLADQSGDPSIVTSYGVLKGITAGINEVYGDDSLEGKVMAIQGLGAVGYKICEHLHAAGAKLYVTDIRKDYIEQVVEEFDATAVAPDEIYKVEADVFVPCAMGAIINDFTIEQLQCKIIAGSANNQLAEEKHGDILKEKKILYIPDFVINSGGAINVYEEMRGYNEERAMERAGKIYDTIKKIIELSKKENISTNSAAVLMAKNRIENVGQVQSIFLEKR